MEKLISKFVSLNRLASETKLPKKYLLRLAEKKKIPALQINGRYRFNLATAQQALADLAAKGGGNDYR